MKLKARPTPWSSVCSTQIEKPGKEEEQIIPLQTATKRAHTYLISRGEVAFFALSTYQALCEEFYAHYFIEFSQLTSQESIILPSQTG